MSIINTNKELSTATWRNEAVLYSTTNPGHIGPSLCFMLFAAGNDASARGAGARFLFMMLFLQARMVYGGHLAYGTSFLGFAQLAGMGKREVSISWLVRWMHTRIVVLSERTPKAIMHGTHDFRREEKKWCVTKTYVHEEGGLRKPVMRAVRSIPFLTLEV